MQAIVQQIHRANMKAILLSRISFLAMTLNIIAMLILIITWAISISKEGGGVLARYGACIVAFILLTITTILAFLITRLQPQLLLYYSHEVLSILTLIVMSIAMGMNNVVVDLCSTHRELRNTQCGAHVAELIAELMVCLSMGFNFASTQQRIVTFIDKGILDGIKGRSNGMTQLP